MLKKESKLPFVSVGEKVTCLKEGVVYFMGQFEKKRVIDNFT